MEPRMEQISCVRRIIKEPGMGFKEHEGETAPNHPRPARLLPGGRLLSLRCRKNQVLAPKHLYTLEVKRTSCKPEKREGGGVGRKVGQEKKNRVKETGSNRKEARETSRERDEGKRHRDGGREQKAQPLGKQRGGDKTQLSPDCGPAILLGRTTVRGLTSFNEGEEEREERVGRVETSVCP